MINCASQVTKEFIIASMGIVFMFSTCQSNKQSVMNDILRVLVIMAHIYVYSPWR